MNNPEIGEIILDKVSAKSSIGHGVGRKKAIAYRALPEVLEKGKIIYFSDNWKQRRYQTCAVAAPFNIETEQYYMVVIVSNKTKKDRYYTHDVAYIKIDDTLFKTWSEDSNNPAFSGNVPSTYSLLYELIKVKSMQDTEDTLKETNKKIRGSNVYQPESNDYRQQTRATSTDIKSQNENDVNENDSTEFSRDELYSSEGDEFSPRYILATTLLNTVTNTEEYANLKKYQEHIKAIEDKETRLAITRNAIHAVVKK